MKSTRKSKNFRLEWLVRELTELAQELRKLVDAEQAHCSLMPIFVPRPAVSPAQRAREIYEARRQRDALFSEKLFAEPAWDMLLDLFIQNEEGRQVSVSSACIASAVPATTGLRWLSALERAGMVERKSDPVDHRRTFVELSPETRSRLADYLGGIALS